MLAEAWERVEQARIETLEHVARESLASFPGTELPDGGFDRAVAQRCFDPDPRSAGADSDPHNPVDQAILRQFQTLCSDVRQSAQARRPALRR